MPTRCAPDAILLSGTSQDAGVFVPEIHTCFDAHGFNVTLAIHFPVFLKFGLGLSRSSWFRTVSIFSALANDLSSSSWRVAILLVHHFDKGLDLAASGVVIDAFQFRCGRSGGGFVVAIAVLGCGTT